jgi:hypothetical protein
MKKCFRLPPGNVCFQAFHFLDKFNVLYGICSRSGPVDDGNCARSAAEVIWKGRGIERSQLSHLIRHVDDHFFDILPGFHQCR